jgi:peptidoglycan hydrolase-like protein with peptidoglycan-binding domain
VKTAQLALNRKTASALTVDGDFGPKTEIAVRAYQSKNSLAADAVIGPKTWAKLLGV